MTNLTGSNLNRREATGPKGEGRDSPSTFPKYPEVKDSGVEWLGEVPAHWEVRQARYIFTLQRGHDLPSEKMIAGEFPVQGSNGPIGVHDQYTTVAPGVIVGRSGSVGKVNYVDNYFWAHNTALFVKDFWGYPPRFVYYLLKALDPERLAAGSAVGTLDRNKIHCQYVASPTVEEAACIYAFLDHETARIDALVEQQQRLIELLKEKRQAVISHAVTKGLDPDVPMKDSGIEWMGEVPAHWDVMSLSRILEKVEQGWSPNASNVPAAPSEWGVVKLSAIKKGGFKEEENKTLLADTDPDHKLEIKNGDLLVTRANTPELVADACVVKIFGESRLMLSDLVYRLKLVRNIDSWFVCWFLISDFGRSQIESDARGSSMSMAKVSQSHIKGWLLPLPSAGEQRSITDHIYHEVDRIDRLFRECENTLQLFTERRSALISAAVTGKIDVRGWQPPAVSSAPAEVTQAEEL